MDLFNTVKEGLRVTKNVDNKLLGRKEIPAPKPSENNSSLLNILPTPFANKQPKKQINLEPIDAEELEARVNTVAHSLFNENSSFESILRVMVNVNHYSFHNQMLVAHQCPHATLVAGSGSFAKNHNRQLKNDANYIQIVSPVWETVPDIDENGKPIYATVDGVYKAKTTDKIVAYKPIAVYDITETIGNDVVSVIDGIKQTYQQNPNLVDNTLVEINDYPVYSYAKYIVDNVQKYVAVNQSDDITNQLVRAKVESFVNNNRPINSSVETDLISYAILTNLFNYDLPVPDLSSVSSNDYFKIAKKVSYGIKDIIQDIQYELGYKELDKNYNNKKQKRESEKDKLKANPPSLPTNISNQQQNEVTEEVIDVDIVEKADLILDEELQNKELVIEVSDDNLVKDNVVIMDKEPQKQDALVIDQISGLSQFGFYGNEGTYKQHSYAYNVKQSIYRNLASLYHKYKDDNVFLSLLRFNVDIIEGEKSAINILRGSVFNLFERFKALFTRPLQNKDDDTTAITKNYNPSKYQQINQLKNQIENQVDIVRYIGRYVKLDGKNKAICPFPDHIETTPSFTVNVKTQRYKCFGCGKTGNVITFAMEYHDLSFEEAIFKIAEDEGIDLSENIKSMLNSNNIPEPIAKKLGVNKDYANYLELALNRNINQPAYKYLENRGFNKETIEHFKIGYAPDETTQLKYLESQLDKALLIDNNLFVENSDNTHRAYFSDRIVVPVYDRWNNIAGFNGRNLLGENDNPNKYLNSPTSDTFTKGSLLYNYNNLVSNQPIYLVEGCPDTWSMWQSGITNTAGSMSSELTDEQIVLIKQKTNHVVMFYDYDKIGIEKTLINGAKLSKAGLDVDVVDISNIVDIKDRYDPAELMLYCKQNSVDFKQLVNDSIIDFHQFKLNQLMNEFDRTKNNVNELCSIIESVVGDIPVYDTLKVNLVAAIIAEKTNYDLDLIKEAISNVDKSLNVENNNNDVYLKNIFNKFNENIK